MKETVSGIFVITVGIIVLVASQNIRRMTGVSIGSDFFPKISAGMLLFLGVIILLKAFMEKGIKVQSAKKSEQDQEEEVIVEIDRRAPLISIMLLAVYIGFLENIGFLIMTILYLFSQITLLAPKHKRKYLKFGVISIVVTVIVYLAFVKGLSVMLPAGIMG